MADDGVVSGRSLLYRPNNFVTQQKIRTTYCEALVCHRSQRTKPDSKLFVEVMLHPELVHTKAAGYTQILPGGEEIPQDRLLLQAGTQPNAVCGAINLDGVVHAKHSNNRICPRTPITGPPYAQMHSDIEMSRSSYMHGELYSDNQCDHLEHGYNDIEADLSFRSGSTLAYARPKLADPEPATPSCKPAAMTLSKTRIPKTQETGETFFSSHPRVQSLTNPVSACLWPEQKMHSELDDCDFVSGAAFGAAAAMPP